MIDNKDSNPFEGFKALEGDTIAPSEMEVLEVPEVEALGEDTGIADMTEDAHEIPIEEETLTEKKEDLSIDNLEIEFKDIVDEQDEVVEDEFQSPEENKESKVEPEDLSQIGVLAKHLKEEGVLEFEEDDFEDSEEGLVNAVKSQIKKGVKDYKENLDPLAQQFLDYIEDGGDPQHFTKAYSTVDFAKIDTDSLKGKSELQKQLVAELMRREGYDREEIVDEIQDLLTGNVLNGRASRSLRKLQNLQQKERATLLQSQKDENEKKKETQVNFLNSLRDNIDGKEDIAGFPINKKQKNAFYEYITKPDRKSGKTRLVIDSESDKDAQLKMAWFYFNKFNFEKVEKKARTKAVSNLRTNLERASGVSRGKLKSKSRTKTSGSDSDFSLFSKAMKL
tara:strand:+ start:2403 stop:3581 length:1179 start_codon:yes stop_codon:yes gene_type:complete